ncbi:MAG: GWxTD domain-containing protein [Bacteroidales bacterium]|jgi:GWxTD domain-containing protein|nr:GWxTD domain-containing protein [Bacteroidales bacterium]
MKKILIAISLLVVPFVGFSQGLNLIYSFTTYSSAEGNFVEINTSIDASSIEYVKKDNGKYQAALDMTLVVYTDSLCTKALYVEQRSILSPEITSEENRSFASLYDVQKVVLPNGSYPFYLKIRDKNAADKAREVRDIIKMNYKANELAISDIKLVSSYTKTKTPNAFSKNGYDINPYLFESYGIDDKQMIAYAELYNVDKLFGNNKSYVIGVAVEDYNTSKAVADIGKRTKAKTKSLETIFETIDISNLKKGYYNLVVEVRDSNNLLYADKKYAFLKDGNAFEAPVALDDDTYLDNITDPLALIDDIESLAPIANKTERNFIDKEVKGKSTEELRNFLYSYWGANYPDNPKEGYSEYHKRAKYVSQHFATPTKKGYYTDMGRIYMIYGQPDNIIDERFKQTTAMRSQTPAELSTDPEVRSNNNISFTYLPYQMWRYDRTAFGETNRTFVFYAPMNDVREYRLLHSNAKGEPTTLFWERVLSRNNLPEYTEGEAGIQFKRGY